MTALIIPRKKMNSIIGANRPASLFRMRDGFSVRTYESGSIFCGRAYSLAREGKEMANGNADAFRDAVKALGKEAQMLLGPVGEQEMALAGELRLRVGSPAVLSLPAGIITIGTSPITRRQMDDMVLSLCGHSIYSHQQEMAAGFISLPGGHRAGLCGRAVVCDGVVSAIRDVSSICLRIAREYKGCARELTDRLFSDGLCSAVIAGAPGSGKTTLLRDTAGILAGGGTGRSLQAAIIDERGEFSLGDGRIASMCDVLSGYPKAVGIMTALRSLSPDVIICDELGGEEDIRAVRAGINAGVHILCSIHAGSVSELAKRPQTAALLKTGGFHRFALLGGRERPGKVDFVLGWEEIYEMACGGADNILLDTDGTMLCRQAATTQATA